jgi:hypothetical protein
MNPMAETDIWLAEFGKRHSKVNNPATYWVSMLLLLLGTVGILWSLPVPGAFVEISPLLNWGSTFLMAAVIYYFIISVPLGLGMLPFICSVWALQICLSARAIPLEDASSVMIGAGVAGLTLEHYAGGGLRAVMRDVQLIMIAPLWLLAGIYRRLGIPF